MKTIEKMSKAFKLYKYLKDLSDMYTNQRPNGCHGIAVQSDPLAKKWQSINFRTHVIEQYILNEPINWYNARWLTNDEAEKRNNEQK